VDIELEFPDSLVEAIVLSTRFFSLPILNIDRKFRRLRGAEHTKFLPKLDVGPPFIVKVRSVGEQTADKGDTDKRQYAGSHCIEKEAEPRFSFSFLQIT
jgi:hypothetical protein